MSPFRAPFAPSDNPETFLGEYLRLLERNTEQGTLAQWLFRNAKRMKAEMFSASLWRELEPHEVLALRACAPAGVFVPEMKERYVAQVGSREELKLLADVLFESDFALVNGLPEQYRGLRSPLIQLMMLAYRNGVRSPDQRVRDL